MHFFPLYQTANTPYRCRLYLNSCKQEYQAAWRRPQQTQPSSWDGLGPAHCGFHGPLLNFHYLPWAFHPWLSLGWHVQDMCTQYHACQSSVFLCRLTICSSHLTDGIWQLIGVQLSGDKHQLMECALVSKQWLKCSHKIHFLNCEIQIAVEIETGNRAAKNWQDEAQKVVEKVVHFYSTIHWYISCVLLKMEEYWKTQPQKPAQVSSVTSTPSNTTASMPEPSSFLKYNSLITHYDCLWQLQINEDEEV